MGRTQKVIPGEVLDLLKSNNSITKKELAEHFDVCEQTISNKVKKLRDDGEKIIHDQNGLLYLDEVVDEETYDKMNNYMLWVVREFRGIIRCGKPIKPILKLSNEYMRQLNSDERRSFKKLGLQIVQLADYAQIQEEMEM